MGSFFFIGFAALAVSGGAAVLLSHSGRSLAVGWALTCLSLSALILFHPGPPWLISLLVMALALGLGAAFPSLVSDSVPGFLSGGFRRALAIASVWGVSLLVLRSSHRSPHLILDVGASAASSHLYWSLYTTAALFGLGILTLILKRGAAHVWAGIGLLLLSPMPAALASAARLQSGDGWLLALFCVGLCALHGLLALPLLGRIKKLGGNLDTQAWEDFQG